MSDAEQLTIYVTEGERSQGKLLYQALMDTARQSGIIGMTLMRSAVGYGQWHRHISVDWIMELAPELIVILTVIDQPRAIARFLPHVQALVHYGVATQETVDVVHHVPIAEDLPIQPLSTIGARNGSRRHCGSRTNHCGSPCAAECIELAASRM